MFLNLTIRFLLVIGKRLRNVAMKRDLEKNLCEHSMPGIVWGTGEQNDT